MELIESEQKVSEMVSRRDGYELGYVIGLVLRDQWVAGGSNVDAHNRR